MARQTARLLGFGTGSVQDAAGSPVPFSTVLTKLDDLVKNCGRVLGGGERTTADQASISIVMQGVELGAALQRVPADELREKRELVNRQLTKWVDTAVALHEKLEKQHGEFDPVTFAALECRIQASVASLKTSGVIDAAPAQMAKVSATLDDLQKTCDLLLRGSELTTVHQALVTGPPLKPAHMEAPLAGMKAQSDALSQALHEMPTTERVRVFLLAHQSDPRLASYLA